MITAEFVNISFNNGAEADLSGETVKIVISGHSLFDVKGKDIVCSAVSVIALSVFKAFTVSAGIPQKTEQNEGFLKTVIKTIDIKDRQTEFRTLADVLLIGLYEIKRLYPENIEIKFVKEN